MCKLFLVFPFLLCLNFLNQSHVSIMRKLFLVFSFLSLCVWISLFNHHQLFFVFSFLHTTFLLPPPVWYKTIARILLFLLHARGAPILHAVSEEVGCVGGSVEAAIARRPRWWIRGDHHCRGGLTLELSVEVRGAKRDDGEGRWRRRGRRSWRSAQCQWASQRR
jgi:hypothetical protein